MWVHVVLLLGILTAAAGLSVRSLTMPLKLATQRRCGGCWPVRMWTSTNERCGGGAVQRVVRVMAEGDRSSTAAGRRV